jgi:hypothetical protein
MTTKQLNIAAALNTATEMIKRMLSQGFGEEKYVFALSNMICENYNLTQKESIIIIEEAVKIA